MLQLLNCLIDSTSNGLNPVQLLSQQNDMLQYMHAVNNCVIITYTGHVECSLCNYITVIESTDAFRFVTESVYFDIFSADQCIGSDPVQW